jgi:copper chaperone CopZ
MAIRSDTIQVTGIRCERCVLRLGAALEGLEGLEAANATLMGQVVLTWNDERVAREEIVERMTRAGFRPLDDY